MFIAAFVALFAVLAALAYRFIRALLPRGRKTTIATIAFFAAMFLSFIIRRYVHTPPANGALEAFFIAGNFHVVAALYLSISSIITESILFAHRAFRRMTDETLLRSRRIISYPLILITIALITGGYANTLSLHTAHYNLAAAKRAPIPSLRVVAVSDIHAGDITKKDRLTAIAERINELNPDCVIVAGDLFDHSVDNVAREGTLVPLSSVRAKRGKFLALGNHDYFGGADKAQRYAESLGFTVLRDRVVSIDGLVRVAGREDYSVGRRFGIRRKELSAIITGTDRTLPLILIDHQPNMIGDAVADGVDLQISGHTHDGQLWPINLITDIIYDPAYGHRRIGQTDVIVTSGAGTWGPPVRTSGRCEIACIDIRFTGK